MMQTRMIQPRNAAIVLGTWMVVSLTTPIFAVDILDDPVQIEERLTQLIQTSNSLCWEMHRFHRQQPDYQDSYQSAKDLWSQANRMRDAVLAGPVESETLNQRVTEMNETFAKVEQSLMKWGSGDLSSIELNSGRTVRTVVTPGIGIDIPFLNFQVGGGSEVEVVDEGQPQLQRRRIHPNAHGTKRSLERELTSVKLALVYLNEDAGTPLPQVSPVGAGPASTGDFPQPPRPDSGLEQQSVVPAKKSK